MGIIKTFVVICIYHYPPQNVAPPSKYVQQCCGIVITHVCVTMPKQGVHKCVTRLGDLSKHNKALSYRTPMRNFNVNFISGLPDKLWSMSGAKMQYLLSWWQDKWSESWLSITSLHIQYKVVCGWGLLGSLPDKQTSSPCLGFRSWLYKL